MLFIKNVKKMGVHKTCKYINGVSDLSLYQKK